MKVITIAKGAIGLPNDMIKLIADTLKTFEDHPDTKLKTKYEPIDYSNKWQNIFRLNSYRGEGGYPTNPEIGASKSQLIWLENRLREMDIDPVKVRFELDNRLGGQIEKKGLKDLDKGDYTDIRTAISRNKLFNHKKIRVI